MEPTLDKVGDLSKCMRFRRAEVDGMYNLIHYINSSSNKIEARWYDLVPISLVRSVYHIVRSKICVAPFSSELWWPFFLFYADRVYHAKD